MSIIEFKNVSKQFEVDKKTITALDDITLNIDKGDIYAVIGYSGAGKSTLLRLINGLEKATSGSITADGVEIVGANNHVLNDARKDIGMIFQQFNLFGSRTVAGNVEYPLKESGVPRAERKQRTTELLEFVGLDKYAKSYPDQLSGGQKQRVGIARSLATHPHILLADEPTSALDPDTTAEVLDLLKKVNKEFGITIVIITHEMDVVRQIANKVAILSKGELIEKGNVFDVFSQPQTSTAKRFVSTVIQNDLTDDELALIRKEHNGRIFQIDVGDRSKIGDALSEAARAGLNFEVVFGGIAQLENQSFGRLAIQLTGDDEVIDKTVKNLKNTTQIEEVFYPKSWDLTALTSAEQPSQKGGENE